jgi:hypothetical protein
MAVKMFYHKIASSGHLGFILKHIFIHCNALLHNPILKDYVPVYRIQS